MTHVLDALGRIKEYWGSVALADLDDYAQGVIIRGGAADWEAHAAETNHFILVGDGTDIVSKAFDWDDMTAGAGADMVHDHSAAGEGGQLDWDNVWSDAVHDHSSAAEGGTHWGGITQTFGGGAGANIVTIPDGIDPAFTLVDDGGVPIEFLRLDTLNNEIVFNHLELDVDVRFAALAMTNAFFLRGSDGLISWGGPALIVANNWELRLSDNVASAMRFIDLGDANDYLTFVTTDGSREVVINEDGHANIDFRVEWDTGTQGFFLRASDGVIIVDGPSMTVPDGWTLGQAAGPLLTFNDTNNRLAIMGCNVGIGTINPGASRLYVTINLAGNLAMVLENLSATGFGVVIAAGSTTEYALDLRNNTVLGTLWRCLGNGNVGFGAAAPGSITEWNMADQDVEFVDGHNASAVGNVQDVIEVQIGGATAYIACYDGFTP